MSNPVNDILKLPIEERVFAVEKIWNSIEDDTLPVSEDEIQIAQSRYNEYLKNPSDSVAWRDVKAGLIKKYGF
ncbi:MAG: addiction module protein [Chitinophagaceae bacterium]